MRNWQWEEWARCKSKREREEEMNQDNLCSQDAIDKRGNKRDVNEE